MKMATGGSAAGMPRLPEVWQWQEQLVGFGTRYTGSSGHAAYVDWLAGQLSAVPGLTTRTDRLAFSRWLAREFSLTVSVPASVGLWSRRLPFLRVFQHAPGGVDVQDLRPLRGRPSGPIPDPDAYPDVPHRPPTKIKNTENEVDRPRPFQG